MHGLHLSPLQNSTQTHRQGDGNSFLCLDHLGDDIVDDAQDGWFLKMLRLGNGRPQLGQRLPVSAYCQRSFVARARNQVKCTLQGTVQVETYAQIVIVKGTVTLISPS